MPPSMRTAARPLATAAATATATPGQLLSPFRTFTTTSPREKMTRKRREMYLWLQTAQARALESNIKPTYIGPLADQPFPLNSMFRSQSVLSDETREVIYAQCTEMGQSLKAVAAELGLDVRRVAAVVRLKAVERQWEEDVSLPFFLFYLILCVMKTTFSISLEDIKYGYPIAFYLSDCKPLPRDDLPFLFHRR